VAAQSKVWVCGHSLAGTGVSNPAGGHGYLSVVNVACCHEEVSAVGLASSRGVLPSVMCRYLEGDQLQQ